MARTIQHKRGLEKNLPTLKSGELAVTTDTKKVFVGTDNGNIEVTNKAAVDSLTSQLAEISREVEESATLKSPDGNEWFMSVGNDGSLSSRKKYVWVENFTGNTLDLSKWNYELGYVRNSEPQKYTDSTNNVFIRDGQLVLKSIRDAEGKWTSGSVTTNNKFEFTNGYLEARMKLPKGKGIWAAFWLLGWNNEKDYSVSPAVPIGLPYVEGREIDIVEYLNSDNDYYSTIHRKATPTATTLTSTGVLRSPKLDVTQFHKYAVKRTDTQVIFYLDDVPYWTHTIDDEGIKQPMYMIFNLAMGGWSGTTDETTPDENEMIIDYVRFTPLENEQVIEPESVKLNVSEISFEETAIGETRTISANVLPIKAQNKTLKWTSSDTSIATVHGGVVKLIKPGSCTITAETHNGKKATCTVKMFTIEYALFDDFTRADSSTLGKAKTGQDWVVTNGTWEIKDNQAKITTNTGNSAATIDTGVTKGNIQVTIAKMGTGSNTRILFRQVDVDNALEIDVEQIGAYTIHKRVNGTKTVLKAVPRTVANGDIVKINLDGTSVKIYVNNTEIYAGNVSEFVNATKMSLFVGGTDTGQIYDNVKAESTT